MSCKQYTVTRWLDGTTGVVDDWLTRWRSCASGLVSSTTAPSHCTAQYERENHTHKLQLKITKFEIHVSVKKRQPSFKVVPGFLTNEIQTSDHNTRCQTEHVSWSIPYLLLYYGLFSSIDLFERNVCKTYLFMFTFHLYKISADYLFKDCHGLHHSSKIFLFQFAHAFPFSSLCNFIDTLHNSKVSSFFLSLLLNYLAMKIVMWRLSKW